MSDETPGVGQGALPPRESQGLRAVAERPAASSATVRVAQVVGGQYVLTTQAHGMPALAQITTGNVAGNSNVTRLISISPARVGQTSPLRPSLANQSIVNVLTKARPNSNVRLQLFPSGEASGNSMQHIPHARSLKRPLSSTGDKKDSYATKLQHVMNHRIVRSKLVKEKYNEHLLEAYYLETGNNILDLYQFAKRPKTQAYLAYLKEHAIDPRDYPELSPSVHVPQTTPSTPSATSASSLPGISHSYAIQTSTSTVTTPESHSNTSTPKSVNVKMKSTSHTSSASQEMIVEKAKQEAYVVQRIADLQKDGLWAERRLPKVQEMARTKAHWDFLLEEMVWLAADFAQERKWKKAAAKKCARMVQKYFQEKALAAQRAEKAHEQNLRRIAAFCAKEVKNFWNNVEKLVEYKQNTILEEKRKKALDQQLSFIVDQTEKYSQLLAEGMNKSVEQPPSSAPSRSVSRAQSDTEFDPDLQSDEDDEETIAQEEAALGNAGQTEEIEALQKESQMELDDLLEDDLLRNYLLNRDKIRISESEDSDDDDGDSKKEGTSKADDESDDSDSSKEEEECEDSEVESEDETKVSESATQGEHEELKLLVEDSHKEGEVKTETDTKDDLINDAAAIAESIQPKGNTLSSTNVSTNIPFLLKYSLREYQHIGLDWLVTMFERKLNGILADEMGLGKTIQTIALLAHLACEKENWGPHLIVVPTSVMLNWEMECKKWCPAFKILTYYGSQKERKFKRIGWTKPNAFHICITSYKLVIQDHQSFRRKKWKYLILDEAQNIKNFKSQRWQLLLNFQTQQRLLLTGTPLQNNLMELWSLMHFLMPNVFQSHREFKEWFSNPVTGMIEGNSEYNESIIKRLHKVLRPFLLRRLKSEVEKQMPKKYEHVVMCRLSKRQRYLYDDYMSRANTRETLSSGNLLSVINVLMQLRKVCNHPNLFEIRPTISPFQCEGIRLHIPSIVYSATDYDVTKHVNLQALNLLLLMQEVYFGSYQCYRMRQSRHSKKIMELDQINLKNPPPCPPCKLAMRVFPEKNNSEEKLEKKEMPMLTPSQPPPLQLKGISQSNMKVKVSGVQLVNPQGILKTIPVVNISQGSTGQIGTPVNVTSVLKPPDKISASFAQLVQTSTGKHLLLTSNPNITANIPVTTTTGGQKLTFLSKQPVSTIGSAGHAVTKAYVKFQLTSVTTASTFTTVSTVNSNTISVAKSDDNKNKGRTSVGIDYIGKLYSKQNALDVRWNSDEKNIGLTNEDDPKGERRNRLALMTRINKIRCSALPLYGRDFQDAVKIFTPNKKNVWDGGSIHCLNSLYNKRTSESTDCLKDLLYNPERRLDELKYTFDRFIFYVPAVKAVDPELQVWHPPPSKYWGQKQDRQLLQKLFLKPATPLHSIASAMVTQFPDPRLIQYDCGKLQTLDRLLRKLKAEGHRALIFTQMTKMLDVLEAFLNYHGHIYLRLDGTTKVDQRQVLMERFNGDKRIFAFILSTRSGGVGVNLTGADTVIFYDSDWNPTMDAQAQDRCHRIGQTRDVHIYRLISERTIEENILKKANQKRLLGDLAIEGGNFTTAYFKSSTIQDLFSIDQNEENAAARMSDMIEMKKDREKALTGDSSVQLDDKTAVGALESALAACEDDQDVQAAKTAKAEAVADLAEFDENIPLDEQEKEREPEISKAEQEINNVIEKLTPIEKYAMKFIEATESAWSAEQLAAAEREIEEQKREWELNRLAAMKEEEERRARELEEEGDIITFSREDATNQVSSKNKKFNRASKLLSKKKRGRKKLDLTEGNESKKINSRRIVQKPKESQQDAPVVFESSQVMEESQDASDTNMNNISESDSSDDSYEQTSTSNHVDHNSPRTRSRGTVAINLWTLDVSPILPGEKPMRKQTENNHKKSSKRYKSISEDDDDDSQPDFEGRKPLPSKRKRRRKVNQSPQHSEDEDKNVSREIPKYNITKAKNCKVVLNNIMKDKRFKIPELLEIRDEMEISVELSDTPQDSSDGKQVEDMDPLELSCDETGVSGDVSTLNVEEAERPAEAGLISACFSEELDESILDDVHDKEFIDNGEEIDEAALLGETIEGQPETTTEKNIEGETKGANAEGDDAEATLAREAKGECSQAEIAKEDNGDKAVFEESKDEASLVNNDFEASQNAFSTVEDNLGTNDDRDVTANESSLQTDPKMEEKIITGTSEDSKDEYSLSKDTKEEKSHEAEHLDENKAENYVNKDDPQVDPLCFDDIIDENAKDPEDYEAVHQSDSMEQEESNINEENSLKELQDDSSVPEDIKEENVDQDEQLEEIKPKSDILQDCQTSILGSEEKVTEAVLLEDVPSESHEAKDDKGAQLDARHHTMEEKIIADPSVEETQEKTTVHKSNKEQNVLKDEYLEDISSDSSIFENSESENSSAIIIETTSEKKADSADLCNKTKSEFVEKPRFNKIGASTLTGNEQHGDILKSLKRDVSTGRNEEYQEHAQIHQTNNDNRMQGGSGGLKNNFNEHSSRNLTKATNRESPKENIVNNKVDKRSIHMDNGVSELGKMPPVVPFNRNATFRSRGSRRNYKRFDRYSNNRTLDGWVKRSPVRSSNYSDRYGRPSYSDRPDM